MYELSNNKTKINEEKCVDRIMDFYFILNCFRYRYQPFDMFDTAYGIRFNQFVTEWNVSRTLMYE